MRWRKQKIWRLVAQILVGVLTIQWVGIGNAQVRFEEATKPTPIPRVAILDFNVSQGISPIIGRKAADAVALALADTNKYEVVSRSEVENALTELRLNPPLQPNQLTALAKRLEARFVVYGKVLKTFVNEKTGQGSVHLQMLFHDRYLEVPLNGANVFATTPSRPGVEPDILIDQAINIAANQAAQQVLATKLPEGQIMQRVGNTVIINKGHDQGIREGMQFWVYRLVRDPETDFWVRNRTGLIQIESAEARQSSGVIKEEIVPIQYPDRVIGVYDFPKIGVTEPPVRKVRKGAGSVVPTILLIILGIAVLGSLVGRSRRGTEMPSFTGIVINNGRQVKLIFGPARDCVAIEVYRNTAPGINTEGTYPIAILDGQVVKEYNDGDFFESGTVSIEIDEDTPADRLPRINRSLGDPGDEFNRGDFEYEVSYIHQPLQPGLHYWYAIRFVNAVRQSPPPPGSDEEIEPFRLVYSLSSSTVGPFTPLVQLSQADLLEPTGDVNIANVTFRFVSAQGADEYIVQVSDNPAFPAAQTVTIPLRDRLPNPDIGGQEIVIRNQNLSGRFRAGQTLYWRVGYRYSGDFRPPEGGWVFSQVRSFTALIGPPPPG
ncbi:MAG: CsgG/HfaB family protein [Armatimonadetes bacterium]|nr:CsgG/HfaB family protein [Armatimonadota bacterium]